MNTSVRTSDLRGFDRELYLIKTALGKKKAVNPLCRKVLKQMKKVRSEKITMKRSRVGFVKKRHA
jgi:hypothetical protein